MTYTPDQIARAREIARPFMREEWDEIFLGWWDHLPPIQSALAAIAATEAHVTERVEATANVEPVAQALLQEAREIVSREVNILLQSCCLLDHDLNPIRETFDGGPSDELIQMENFLTKLDAALGERP